MNTEIGVFDDERIEDLMWSFNIFQTKMKISLHLKLVLLLSVFLAVKGQDDEYLQKVMAELEIANLELQDSCENLAIIQKSSLIANSFSERIKMMETQGKLLKTLSRNLRPLEDDVPPELYRNWTLLVKPGDSLLTDQDWSTLISYDVINDELVHSATVHCQNDTKGCVYIKNGYENLLETSRNESLLRKSWLAWQTLISAKKSQFPQVLNLVSKAAEQNGFENAQSYWEMLVDKDEAYAVADVLWDEIKPLYLKLQNFVKSRLFRFYNITSSGTEIPVHLLGSNFGDDWSKIANIILPHPLLYNLAESYLNKTKIRDVYRLAEEVTQELALGTLGNQFWTKSVFNMSFCENHVISFCVDEHTELLTCEKTSWTAYLDAFEVSIDVALRNMDYLSLARSDLRYSVIDEAMKSLGSILAIKNMRHKGIWENYLFDGNDTSSQPNEMTQRLLIALRILPKLPYYLAADKYRLHLLENGYEKFEEIWWKYRKEYQGVVGVLGNETDFLADGHMTSNKPYLSKFLGTIVQFQLLGYYEHDWQSSDQTVASNIAADDNFLKMLEERSTMDWPSLIGNFYSIYDLSAESLLNYFAPLNDYFESAPEEQVLMTTTPKPATTTQKEKVDDQEGNHDRKSLNPEIVKTVKKYESQDDEPPLPTKHGHVDENLEGPNPTMENIAMYIGIVLLGVVVVIVVFVIVSKNMAKRRRSNNRRFET